MPEAPAQAQGGEGGRNVRPAGIRSRRWKMALAALAAVAVAWACWRWLPREARRVDGRFRVAVCQYDSRPDSYRWNVEHALRYAREAASHGAGAIILPEYSFCTAADALEGRAYRTMRHMMRRLGPRLGRFCRRHRCYLFVNIPHEPRGGDPGKPLRYNRTLVYAPDGSVAATYDKNLAAVLDEFCQVSEGARRPPVDLDFGRVGLMICKDTAFPRKFKHYRDADLIVAQFGHITDWRATTNDPPWLVNGIATADDDFPDIAARLCETIPLPAVFANKTGMEPEGCYTGGSCAVDAGGRVVARAGYGGDVFYADFELDENGRIRPGASPIPYEPPSPP